ncbi:hypothetical protein [Litorilituus sediminis]|uniref:Uncharacterized protein n=1 Tax=Litorilituus sediminis TaxID=718192 RepID=A0A4P6PB65_9GAMM|nr:hypothetical protein [Litorilituus sediminis]QBG36922.1 hypothetical protein EMK97_14925 [Litorilituus sediminis]
MTEQLPIRLKANDELRAQFAKIHSQVNKLEAQLNFHALTANWFGDEEAILSIELFIESAISFNDKVQVLQSESSSAITFLSDDVFYLTVLDSEPLQYYVALTDKEAGLMQEKPPLVAGLLQMKLTKVLNEIAAKHALTPI